MQHPCKSPCEKGDFTSISHPVRFSCIKECASVCCTGATLITAREIKGLYAIFPVTVGFRRYVPANESHHRLLDAVGINMGGFVIVGDFIAGNWRSKRCRVLLKDNFCSLHEKGLKPLQCSIVPFCAIFPEDLQGYIINEQRATGFARCRGFSKRSEEVWHGGRFVSAAFSRAFYGYQEALMIQRDFMLQLLRLMRGTEGYKALLHGEGILESPVPRTLHDDFFRLCGIMDGDAMDFKKAQSNLFREEALISGKDSVFADGLRELSV